MIIKERNEEIMILRSFISEKITCLNGILIEAEKKIKFPIAFRQVSHLKPNGINGFSFIFVPLFSQIVIKELLIIKVIVIIDGNNKIKDANCTLFDNNFKCEVILEMKNI